MVSPTITLLAILFTIFSLNAAAPIAIIVDDDVNDVKDDWDDNYDDDYNEEYYDDYDKEYYDDYDEEYYDDYYYDEYYDYYGDDYWNYLFTPYTQTQFNKSDANHDGMLSPEEFLQNDFYKSYVQQQQAIFKAMDTNGDGFVTLEEENEFILKEDDLMETWDLRPYDTKHNGNNDSKLQLDEFMRYIQNEYPFDYGNAHKNISEYFAKFDLDGDDSWNLTEMAAWVDGSADWPDDYFEESTLVANDTGYLYRYWYSLDSSDVLLDAKGDGIVTQAEKDAFYALMAERKAEMEESEEDSLIWEMRQYDKHHGGNNDTVLQMTEFVVYCNGEWPERFGPVAYSNITEYFALFDKNKNLVWEENEMALWMEDLESWPDGYIETSALPTIDDEFEWNK